MARGPAYGTALVLPGESSRNKMRFPPFNTKEAWPFFGPDNQAAGQASWLGSLPMCPSLAVNSNPFTLKTDGK